MSCRYLYIYQFLEAEALIIGWKNLETQQKNFEVIHKKMCKCIAYP